MEHPLTHKPKRAVIFGYGNPSRGDDGIGPELMERAEALLRQSPGLGAVELIQDFQLQIEHALDLEGVDLALFLDASVGATAPYTFTRLASAEDASYTTHELSPGAVLHVYHKIHPGTAPPSYLLSVRGDQFDLGAPIAPAATANMNAAWDLLIRLLDRVDPEFWESCLSRPHA